MLELHQVVRGVAHDAGEMLPPLAGEADLARQKDRHPLPVATLHQLLDQLGVGQGEADMAG